MKRRLIWVALFALLLVATAGGFFWYSMGQAMYEPGMLRRGEIEVGSLDPMSTSNDSPWVLEKDVSLHHFEKGEGPTVLFVHGGPGIPFEQGSKALEPLEEDFRFVYYDQRGCGRSSRPFENDTDSSFYQNLVTMEKQLGLGAQIADIERIRRLLGQERLTLMGYSFGGLLATLYAIEFPDHVERLILVCPADVLVLPHPDQDLMSVIRGRLEGQDRDSFDAFLESYLGFSDLFDRDEESMARLNAKFATFYGKALGRDIPVPERNGGFMVQAMYASMGKRHDYRAALASITVPTLVVHAEQDLVDVRSSQRYQQAIDGAKLVTIPQADHFILMRTSEALVRELEAFLTQSS